MNRTYANKTAEAMVEQPTSGKLMQMDMEVTEVAEGFLTNIIPTQRHANSHSDSELFLNSAVEAPIS